MNYLILSPEGNSFYLVPWLNKEKEVDKIYYCILTTTLDQVGKGLNELPEYSKLEMVKDYHGILDKESKNNLIVIIDDVGLGETGKHIREEGFKVIGGGVIADQLEEDRTLATNLMEKVMNVPETYTFDTFGEGITFLKEQDKSERFVFKPSDSEAPKQYTYVSKDVPDLIENIKEFQSDWQWKPQFQLQKVVKGTEVDFNGFFNGKDFINLSIYFENKPIMNDDIGPSGGGAIALSITRPYTGVFADILDKIKPIFVKDGYRGCIAINSIVSEEDKKPYFLEFTNRFGYPALPMDITLLDENDKTPHDLFKALAQGDKPKLFVENKPCVVVSVGVPPYPSHEGLEKVKGTKMNWDKEWDQYFFASFVMKGKKDEIVLAGGSAECLQVTCIDDTIDGAVSMLYDTYMPTLRLKGAMYRTDCGKDAKKRLAKIKDYNLF